MKNERGITLIALIITIIVLLILAGVSLNAVIGDNGIISQAQKAKIETEDAELWEQIQTCLVELNTEKFSTFGDKIEWIRNKFNEAGIEATAEIYDFATEQIAITYGVNNKRLHLVILDKNNKFIEGMITIASADAYVENDENNQGEWKIEVITAENASDKYGASEGTCRIIGYYGEYGDIEIPNLVYYSENGTKRGYLVTELANNLFAFLNDEDTGEVITSVKLNEGLQRIGDRCFQNDSLIDCTITFPNSLKYIGNFAFSNCSLIKGDLNVIAKQGIAMGKNAFNKCNGMTGDITVIMPQKESDGTYSDETMDSYRITATLSNGTTESYYGIPEGFLSGCSGLTGKLVIPSFIERIDKNAFYNCSGITEINFSEATSLKKIGEYAFYNCNKNTKDISFIFVDENNDNIPDLKIGNNAFCQAQGGDIDLSNVASIGSETFYYYSSSNESGKSNVNLGSTITLIPKQCFAYAEISNVTGNSNNLELLEYAFFYSGIARFIVNSNVTFSGQSVFIDCFNLTKFYSLDEYLDITKFSFYLNRSLIDISFKPISIGEYGFYDCRNLKSIDLSNIVFIGQSAFEECKALEKIIGYSGQTDFTDIITILSNVPITQLSSNAFRNCSKLTGNFNGEIYNSNNDKISIGSNPFIGTQVIKSIVKIFDIPSDVTIITSEQFRFADEIQNADNQEITEIVIPNNITSIGDYAFAGCKSITSITIPNSVTSIGIGAFSGCSSLISIKFPDNAEYTSIGKETCSSCGSLTQVSLPSSISKLEENAFSMCKSLKTINLNNIEYIEERALVSCPLTSVTFSNNLKKMGYCSFQEAFDVNGIDIIIPQSVINFEANVFYKANLKNVTINTNIALTYGMFQESKVKTITLSSTNNYTTLASRVFYSCKNLTQINNLNWSNITTIFDEAFAQCSNWKETIYLSTNCRYDDDVFSDCGVTIKTAR